MNEIKEIYKVERMNRSFTYAGTLRNEFKFEMDEDVFFVIKDNQIARGRVIGVEKTISDNPDYIYKITIPEGTLGDEIESVPTESEKFMARTFPDEAEYKVKDVTLKCDRIFKTIGDAKRSAMEQTEHLYNVQKRDIERYFKQFEK